MRRNGLTPYPWQEEFLRLRPYRALICWARQAGGKSTALSAAILSQCFYRAGSLVLISSYTEEKSKDLLAKSVLLHGPYAKEFPLTIDSTKRKRFRNGSQIWALSGKTGAPRGATAHLVVFDEAAWTEDELRNNAVATMQTTDGPMWAVSTPPETPERWWWAAWTANGLYTAEEALIVNDGWFRSYRPVSQCPNRNQSFLDSEKSKINEVTYMREYECQFPGFAAFYAGRPFSPAMIAGIPESENAGWGV